MAITDLIPWRHRRDVTAGRREELNPFLTLHREMNRLFDDVFRGFELAPFGATGRFGWPNIELSENDKEVKVTAELPGLEEKDLDVQIANGVLVIKGEKRTETADKDRRFSELYYGSFDRRIPVDEVDEDKATASFKNGVLTVALPKLAPAKENVKRIAISGK